MKITKGFLVFLFVAVLALTDGGSAEVPSCLEQLRQSVEKLSSGTDLEVHFPLLEDTSDEERCRRRYDAFLKVATKEIALHAQRKKECAELREFLGRDQADPHVGAAIQARLAKISRTCDLRHLDIFSIAPWSPTHPSSAFFRPTPDGSWVREARVAQRGSSFDVAPWEAGGSVSYETYE